MTEAQPDQDSGNSCGPQEADYPSVIATMLRTIATSLAEAAAILLFAGLCFFLAIYLVEKHSFDTGPLFLLLLYCLPIGVAALRKHNALLDIMVTNLWLGWTGIGWLVALIWACDTNVETSSE